MAIGCAIDVGIGVVMRGGRILICRRQKDAVLGGMWEFPGGKVEEGETAADCVVRELAEEVALNVRTLHPFQMIEWTYPSGIVRLHPYFCEYEADEAEALESDELRWVKPADLGQFHFPPANATLIDEVLEYLENHSSGPAARYHSGR